MVVDRCDKTGRTALMNACETGRMAIFQYLLKKGANISAEDCRRRTALHMASANGHLEIVQALLEKDADHLKKMINAQDCYTGAELCILIRGKDKGNEINHLLFVYTLHSCTLGVGILCSICHIFNLVDSADTSHHTHSFCIYA